MRLNNNRNIIVTIVMVTIATMMNLIALRLSTNINEKLNDINVSVIFKF